MDYEKMSLDELKDYAKSIGLTVGNIGKEKLIKKIKEKEAEKATVESVFADDDLEENKDEAQPVQSEEPKNNESLLDSIASAIDDLDDSADEKIEEIVDYIINTPYNTNPNVLRGMLNQLVSTITPT